MGELTTGTRMEKRALWRVFLLVDNRAIRLRWFDDDGPDEAQGADGERAAFGAEAAGWYADRRGVAEGGKKEEVAVTQLVGHFVAQAIVAELLVDVAVAGGEFEEVRVGVIHESPAVLLLAGIEQNQRGERGRDEEVSELVAHGWIVHGRLPEARGRRHTACGKRHKA